MNNEFQWRNEMRKLGGPVEPARDLWPAIAVYIAAHPTAATAATRGRHVGWLALAATVIVAVGSTFIAYRWQRSEPVVDGPKAAQTQAQPSNAKGGERPEEATGGRELQRTALDWAVPADPQLAVTAENLDSASAQLQDALEQRPDAVFLVGLLNRTNAQRLRLMRKSPYAG